MSEYTSILCCFHKDHIDVFQNGLPVGVIRDDKFHVHQRSIVDGDKMDALSPYELYKLAERLRYVEFKIKMMHKWKPGAAEAIVLLKTLEWDKNAGGPGNHVCRICRRWQQEGHAPDCKLARLLRDS